MEREFATIAVSGRRKSAQLNSLAVPVGTLGRLRFTPGATTVAVPPGVSGDGGGGTGR